jgi:CheY-like chemotaxis protein
MDLAMPILDGLAAIAHIRKDSKIATVPIIAVSAYDEAGTRHKAFTAGVNDYLTKPVSFDRLQCAITRLLKAA